MIEVAIAAFVNQVTPTILRASKMAAAHTILKRDIALASFPVAFSTKEDEDYLVEAPVGGSTGGRFFAALRMTCPGACSGRGIMPCVAFNLV